MKSKLNHRLEQLLIVIAIILLSLCLFDSICRSEPYLVYSPTLVVKMYQIEIDGIVSDVRPTQLADGQYQLIYDLNNLSVGSHAIRARAEYEQWGYVDWSEVYNVIRPSKLENPQIVLSPPLP